MSDARVFTSSEQLKAELPPEEVRRGVALGLSAYLFWGLIPIYFKAVAHISIFEVLAHRIVWSLVLLFSIIAARRTWRIIWGVVRDPRTMGVLVVTTLLISGNWLLYIYAVASNHITQASLGYFINPLVNVLLGFVFLRERLRKWQLASIVLAACGVSILTWQEGAVPWISLTLAGTFAFYGLIRKTARVGSIEGLTIECLLLMPVAAGYVIWLGARGGSAFFNGTLNDVALLVLAGAVTAVPLLLFTSAARRLRLSTMGFMQYIAPTLQLLLAVTVYKEDFTPAKLVSFCFIWTGLIVYTADAVAQSRVKPS